MTTDSGAAQGEIAREQQQLDRVVARLEQLRQAAHAREKRSLASPRGGTPQAVYERDVLAHAASMRRAEVDTGADGLLFGRLDRADGETLHIGRIGIRDADSEPLAVDWRAPAAAAFYRATPHDPQGVVRRRTITARSEMVRGVDDELLQPELADSLAGSSVVGDGAFVAALSQARTGFMRDIVATIQAEQDEAVRAPDDGAMVVTGGPGTGKTAVALHRVAYLMYARRDYYTRRGVLVVGPSPAFVDYIGQVLPALGEDSVRLSSLGALPDLPDRIRVTRHDLPAVAVAKGSLRTVAMLDAAVDRLATGGRTGDLVVSRWGHVLTVDADDAARRRLSIAGQRGSRGTNSGRGAFVRSVTDLAWRAWKRRARSTASAQGDEADDRQDFDQWLHEQPAFRSFMAEAWPVLTGWEVLQRMRGDPDLVAEVAAGHLTAAEVEALVGDWSDPGWTPSPADAAIVDELDELVGEPPAPEQDTESDELAELTARSRGGEVTTMADRYRQQATRRAATTGYRDFAHVVVDEAQDVSPLQWRMLGRRAPGASWTIVGDWAQSAWPDTDEVRRALEQATHRVRNRTATLSTNYRTSTEVAALAATVLHRIDPSAKPPRAVRDTGVEPVVHTADDLAAALPGLVDALLDAVAGTVGVVVSQTSLGDWEKLLADRPRRLAVVDTWAVKGLEYDGVLVVDPGAIVAEGLSPVAGLRSLYVAVTRATQRLDILGRQHDGQTVALAEGVAQALLR